MVGIMTAHSLGEGSGVGVSFSGAKGWAQGQLVALAIGGGGGGLPGGRLEALFTQPMNKSAERKCWLQSMT